MAREDVNIKVSANVAEAIRLWKAMEEGPKGMANELEALGTKGKKSATGMGAEFGKLAGQWASVAAAIAGAKKILDAFMESQRQALQRTGDASKAADSMSRELFNLTDGKSSLSQVRNDFLLMAERRKVAPEKAKEVSAALLGAGYDYADVMKVGGSGDAALRTLAATNASGQNVDAKALVDAMTGHLDATGQAKTAENLAAAGMTAQSLFASNKLEITDLEQLAEVSAVVKQATGLGNEQMVLLSQFKDKVPASIGSTALRGSIGRLLNAGNVRSSRAALNELGLKPEDVDFNGESFYDVQNRLGEAFDRAGPNAARLGYQLFGNEAVLAQSVLFSKEGEALTQRRLAESSDFAGFGLAADTTEGSKQGTANAVAAKGMRLNFDENYVDPEVAREALLNHLKEINASSASRVLREQMFDRTLNVNSDPYEALSYAMPKHLPGTREAAMADQTLNQFKIQIELTDQNGVAIPQKSEVNNVGKNKAPKER